MDLIYKVTAYKNIDGVYDYFSDRLINENDGYFFETKNRPDLNSGDYIYYFFKNSLVAVAVFDGKKNREREGEIGYKLRDVMLYISKEKINSNIISNNICHVKNDEQKNEVERLLDSAVVMPMLQVDRSVENIDEDEGSYPEGRHYYRVHKQIERSRSLVKLAKEQCLKKTGKLECEACETNFKTTYGELGDGFIEAHHKIPVSAMKPNQTSSPEDLEMVCSNCHRMLHRGKVLLTVHDLKKILKENKGTN